MSRKKKKQEKETTIENFYDLKVDEVDELVSILKGNPADESKEVSYEIDEVAGETDSEKGKKLKKFNPYRHDFLSRIPTWIKAILVKWWFAGAVCFFIMMGLGMYIDNNENLLLLTGLVLGIVVDIFVNPIFHFFQDYEGEYDNYMMFPFPFKKFWTFFTNAIYYLIIIILVNGIYTGINLLVEMGGGEWFFGAEPLLFGTFAVIVDMTFIGIKDLIVWLVNRKKKKASEEVPDV